MKSDRISFRIQFNKEDVQYMEDYKLIHRVSVQDFVDLSVKERIERLRVEQYLKDQELNK